MINVAPVEHHTIVSVVNEFFTQYYSVCEYVVLVFSLLFETFRFECLSIPSKYESTRLTHVPFGTTDNLQRGKIPLSGTSAVPTLSPLKFPTYRNLLWALSSAWHTGRVQAESQNGTVDLPYAQRRQNRKNNKKNNK